MTRDASKPPTARSVGGHPAVPRDPTDHLAPEPSVQQRTSPTRTLVHVAATVSMVTAVLAVAPPAGAAPTAPTGDTYEATITRTAYGIPHVVAEDYGSLGFGQGYGAAADIICSLADTMVTVRGERSKYFGPDEVYDDQVTLEATNLQTDALFGDIINRGVVEDLLASDDPGVAPGDEVRAMVRGYVTGLNTYLEDVGGPDGIEDPACHGADWVQRGDRARPLARDLRRAAAGVDWRLRARDRRCRPPVGRRPGPGPARPAGGRGQLQPGRPTSCRPPSSSRRAWAAARTGSAPTAPRWAAT